MRLSFLSSTTGSKGLVSSEPGLTNFSEFLRIGPVFEVNVLTRNGSLDPGLGARFEVSEPEPEAELAGSGQGCGMRTAGSSTFGGPGSWCSHGSEPGSKVRNGLLKKESPGKGTGKVDNMAGKRGSGELGKREEVKDRRAVFKGKTRGSFVWPTRGHLSHFASLSGQLLSQRALVVVVGQRLAFEFGAYCSRQLAEPSQA
ncbi:glycine/sarcosine/betaine reductase complex component A [Striga asiatica]|uniref:Glycine/sarcosine/betaine reductase complex component A n=1 Tax=Striga asiatica TaxID=4170 RepID=A0A5A7PEC6_STRAF|nr:glycine/sarcosine/betaine reductase complex component A [Striga asiatica]